MAFFTDELLKTLLDELTLPAELCKLISYYTTFHIGDKFYFNLRPELPLHHGEIAEFSELGDLWVRYRLQHRTLSVFNYTWIMKKDIDDKVVVIQNCSMR